MYTKMKKRKIYENKDVMCVQWNDAARFKYVLRNCKEYIILISLALKYTEYKRLRKSYISFIYFIYCFAVVNIDDRRRIFVLCLLRVYILSSLLGQKFCSFENMIVLVNWLKITDRNVLRKQTPKHINRLSLHVFKDSPNTEVSGNCLYSKQCITCRC